MEIFFANTYQQSPKGIRSPALFRAASIAVLLAAFSGCGNGDRPISTDFYVATETSGATSYIFKARATPPIADVDDPAMLEDVNSVLKLVSLPPVTSSMRLAPPPEFRPHRTSKHRWATYPGGSLVIERKICKKTYDTKDDYSCVWKITHHVEETPDAIPSEEVDQPHVQNQTPKS